MEVTIPRNVRTFQFKVCLCELVQVGAFISHGPMGIFQLIQVMDHFGIRSPSRRTIADSFWQHGRRSLGFRLNGGNEEAWPCSVEQTAWGCTQSGKPGNGITQLDLLRCYYYIRSAISPGVPGHASNVDETMFYFPETILFRYRDDTQNC